MNKIIVCNGGYRTGSTWLYNVVIKLVKGSGVAGTSIETVGIDQEGGESLIQIRPDLLRAWWLLKCHVFTPKKTFDHVRHIRTYRNPWAVLASHLYIKGLKTLTDEQIEVFCETMSASILRDKQHKDREDSLMINYERLFLLPREIINEVDKFIGSNATGHLKDSIHRELSIGEVDDLTRKLKKADYQTQWRPNHISPQRGAIDGWMNVLDKELMARVEAVGW